MQKPPPRRKVNRPPSTSSVEEVNPAPSSVPSKGKAKAPERIPLPGPSIFRLEEVELYHWEEGQQNFFQQGIVEANIAKQGQGFNYFLCASNDTEGVVLSHRFHPSMNPKYAPKIPSFTWNYYQEGDATSGSWALKFHSEEHYSQFRAMYERCAWEDVNQVSFDKMKEEDRRYILSADEDVEMLDADIEDEEDEEEVLSELDPDGICIAVPSTCFLLMSSSRRK